MGNDKNTLSICDGEKCAVYFANRAACFLKLEEYEKACQDCTEALKLNPNYVKALMRRCAAREKKGGDDLYGALEDAKLASSLDANSKEAVAAVYRLEPIVAKRQEEQKEEMLGKLKDLGNMFLGKFGLSTDNFKMEQDPNSGGYSMKFSQ